MRTLVLLSAALLCSFSLSGFAQQAPSGQTTPSAEAPARPSAADHRILLDVVVTDKAGTPVPGLQEQDFTILDGGQPLKVASFHASGAGGTGVGTEPALQVILLVDTVNTSFHGVAEARLHLEKFLRQGAGQLALATSLVFVTDTSQDQTAPTRDGNTLADALNSYQSGLRAIGRSQGFYGGQERNQISLSTLERLAASEMTQPGRKLLVWLSPGWPMEAGPHVYLSEKDQKILFNRVVHLSTALREARITLYNIDPLGMSDAGSFRTFFYESFLKGVGSANKVQIGNLGLQVLAVQSGGRVLNTSNDIAGSISSCLADARAFYTLSFDAPPADHPDEYHKLQVRIGKPGLAARTRTGYYAQPYVNPGR